MQKQREIRFRAWDEGNKVMHQDVEFIRSGTEGNDWIIFKSDKQRLEDRRVLDNPYFAQQIKLIQYTGLKDKNGKEIYEGDIVEYQYLNTLEEEVRRAEVKLLPIGDVNRNIEAYYPFCYSISGSYKDRGREITECYLTPSNDCKIIGNIYQNPELLS